MTSDKYFDTETHIIASAFRAPQDYRFTDGLWGPNFAREGQWIVRDASGAPIILDDDAFTKRFINIKMQQYCWTHAGEAEPRWTLGCGCPSQPTASTAAAPSGE